MSKIKMLIVSLIIICSLVGVVSAAECGGNVQCQCGDTLTSDQTMWYDLLDCPDTQSGVYIGIDNVVLDCNNHLIQGLGTDASNYMGIHLTNGNGNQYVTIRNCRIEGFKGGIDIEEGSSNNLIENNFLNYNTESGIIIWLNTNNNLIINNYASHNAQGGIIIAGGTGHQYNNQLIGNTLEYNEWGINLRNSQTRYSVVHSNILRNNNYGIYVTGEYSLIYNNTLANNTINSCEETNSNIWNTSNIGNYWGDYATNPLYPDQYEIGCEGNGIDYHPIWDFDNDGYFNYQDCDDNNPEVNPGHAEVCSTPYDDNCDGRINENCGGGSPLFVKIFEKYVVYGK